MAYNYLNPEHEDDIERLDFDTAPNETTRRLYRVRGPDGTDLCRILVEHRREQHDHYIDERLNVTVAHDEEVFKQFVTVESDMVDIDLIKKHEEG